MKGPQLELAYEPIYMYSSDIILNHLRAVHVYTNNYLIMKTAIDRYFSHHSLEVIHVISSQNIDNNNINHDMYDGCEWMRHV